MLSLDYSLTRTDCCAYFYFALELPRGAALTYRYRRYDITHALRSRICQVLNAFLEESAFRHPFVRRFTSD